ncbi:MAG TPA: methyltransferase domain-containing protein [Planctomycetes bacterium]|nr:methyltransferase domain-containing protein [Planctomycetota bacterium]
MNREPRSQNAPPSVYGEVRSLLRRFGIFPNRRLGQNFLVDVRPADMLADAAKEIAAKHRSRLALEIGMGLGHLAERLVRRGFHVVAAEIDKRLVDAARARLQDATILDSVTIVSGDALQRGMLSDELRQALRTAPQTGKYVFAANLPYSAASPAIVWHAMNPAEWTGAVVMVQKEVAARLAASPGEDDWSALGLFASVAFREVEILADVHPGAFFPPPQVDSSIVRFFPADKGGFPTARLAAFGEYCRRIFSLRKKTLHRALDILGWKEPLRMNTATRVEKAPINAHVKIFERNFPE